MAQATRPDIDIEEDIRDIIAHYPPLQADRRHLHVSVENGVVTLTGHVKSLITRRYLVDRAAQVSGVHAVDSDRLYAEEMIRLEAGRRIPPGVIANTNYGTIILTGNPADGTSPDTLVGALTQLTGVERVVARFE